MTNFASDAQPEADDPPEPVPQPAAELSDANLASDLAIDSRAAEAGAEAEAAARRDERALACCWPLGRSLDAHFVTKIPSRVLVGALQLYLRLEPDERLLAIIDPSHGRDPASGCALTTRRLYWADNTGAFTPNSPSPVGSGERPPMSRSIVYADLATIEADGVVYRIGSKRPEGRLAAITRQSGASGALIDALNAMSLDARGEPAPILSVAADAAHREFPQFARCDEMARSMQREVPRDFPSLLKAARYRVVATPILAAICVAVFAIMTASGVTPLPRDVSLYVDWGANFGPSVVMDGESWRLFTCMFLHFGLLHLGFNLWFLVQFGRLVERLFGTPGFIAIYVLSGLGGGIASLWYHPMVVSAGASGALFGVAGALLGYLVARRDVPPRAILQLFRPGLLVYLGVDSLLGLMVRQIDGACHVGGLATGFICGLMLSRPWPPPPASYALRRRLASAAFIAAGLVGIFVILTPDIRDRLEREPEILAYTESQNAYHAFLHDIERGTHTFDEIAGEHHLCVTRLDQGIIPVASAIEALAKMNARAEANANDLRKITFSAPELKNALEHLILASVHQHQALDALRRFLETGDQQLFDGAGGYQAHARSSRDHVRVYGESCTKYLTVHGLTTGRR